MKYLSVDLGVRNLAWCVIELKPSVDPKFYTIPFQGSEAIIHAWRLVDITEDETEDVNFQTVDISQCVPWFMKTLKKYWNEITDGVDVALIEAQPTGRMLPSGVCINNIRTKVLSHILQAMLIDKMEVRFVSPAKKLKDAIMKDPSKYKDHKKAAIELTDQASQCFNEPWKNWWMNLKGKRDDLADAFLQAIYHTPKLKVKRAKKIKLEIEIPAPDI